MACLHGHHITSVFLPRTTPHHTITRQVGTGVMVGVPYQTVEDMARDLIFLRTFGADMVGCVVCILQLAGRMHLGGGVLRCLPAGPISVVPHNHNHPSFPAASAPTSSRPRRPSGRPGWRSGSTTRLRTWPRRARSCLTARCACTRWRGCSWGTPTSRPRRRCR